MTDTFIGRQVDEYRLEELLGRGGMARVYRGLDVRLRRYAAVKLIDTPFQANDDYIKRFEIEAQSIAQLQHPNIVNVYRYGEDGGLIYIAMQYIEGADLGTVIDGFAADGDFMENVDVQRITREIASALDYAHSRGVIHRDVKPSNIMLNKSGQAILTDFGLALMTDVGTVGEIFGSPHYIAPEQAVSSKAVVPQSDLYSLGVVLFEMFTNVLPFDAPEPLDLAMQHMSDPPPSPRQFRPDLNVAVEGVILKALAKKPEDRFQTGVELANALDTALTRIRTRTPSSSRKSVLDRVEFQMEANPLPAIPAAVAASPPTRPNRHTPSVVSSLPPTIPAASQGSSTRWARYIIGVVMLLAIISAGVLLLIDGNDDDLPASSNNPTEMMSPTIIVAEATDSPEPPTATPFPISTVALVQTPTSTQPPPPTSTATPPPLPTPVTPTVVALAPSRYELLLTRIEGNKGLILTNTGSSAFPLASFQALVKDDIFAGAGWNVGSLSTNECVRVWDSKELESSDFAANDTKALAAVLECDRVAGEWLAVEGDKRFWREAFTVLLDGNPSVTCSKEQTSCHIAIFIDSSMEAVLSLTRTEGKHGLYVTNTGVTPFPLSAFMAQLKNHDFVPDEWSAVVLQSGQCVRVWDKKEVEKDSFSTREAEFLSRFGGCQQVVGEVLTREGGERFWREDYDVLIDGIQVASCDKDVDTCEVRWQ